ncbi:Protein YhjR [Escherichia coli]|nr:Protein YhjR [Escherichia coli]
MNNNEPDTLPDPAIGYIFQNDILALKQAFSLPDIDYADISQREQLAAALKRCTVAGRVCATKVGDW